MEEDLEEISDTATLNGRENDEHEEGEISDDDGEDPETFHFPYCDPGCFVASSSSSELINDPPLYPAPPNISRDYPPITSEITIERVVNPSEVVIYDDLGRTAIFTSPKKDQDSWARGVIDHYNSYYDAHQSSRRGSHVRKKKSCRDVSSKRKRSSKTLKRLSKNKSKASVDKDKLNSSIEKNKSKVPVSIEKEKTKASLEKDKSQASVDKERGSKRRSPSSSSESDDSSGSTCSCSCSTSSVCSEVLILSPPRSRGKENNQGSYVGRKQVLSPTLSQLYFQNFSEESNYKRFGKVKKSYEDDNPLFDKDLYSKRNAPRSRKRDVTRKSSPTYKRVRVSSDKELSGSSVSPPSECETPAKYNVRNEVKFEGKERKRKDLVTASSRNEKVRGVRNLQPPPGSLGEMLLKKSKRGELNISDKTEYYKIESSAKKSTTNRAIPDDREIGEDLSGKTATSNVKGSTGKTATSNVKGNTGKTATSNVKGNTGKTAASNVKGNTGKTAASNVKGSTGKAVNSKTVQNSSENVNLDESNKDIIDMDICNSSEDDNCDVALLEEVGKDIKQYDNILSGLPKENSEVDRFQKNFLFPVELSFLMHPPPSMNKASNDSNNNANNDSNNTVKE